MKRHEMLLTIASEECAEIQQAVSKMLRFGGNATHPDFPGKTNGMQVIEEYYQLEAVIEMLIDENVLLSLTSEDRCRIMANKKSKVEKYLGISRNLGLLDEENMSVRLDLNQMAAVVRNFSDEGGVGNG